MWVSVGRILHFRLSELIKTEEPVEKQGYEKD